jgi:antitoxin (DNA-binding transcriptional repressor) of toxin-antitoxin stability system
MVMTSHSVAEAKTHLSKLIDLAIAGETVVITRHGHPVAEIRRAPRQGRPMTEADLAWLDKHRVKPRKAIDAAMLIRQMRDEGR